MQIILFSFFFLSKPTIKPPFEKLAFLIFPSLVVFSVFTVAFFNTSFLLLHLAVPCCPLPYILGVLIFFVIAFVSVDKLFFLLNKNKYNIKNSTNIW